MHALGILVTPFLAFHNTVARQGSMDVSCPHPLRNTVYGSVLLPDVEIDRKRVVYGRVYISVVAV